MRALANAAREDAICGFRCQRTGYRSGFAPSPLDDGLLPQGEVKSREHDHAEPCPLAATKIEERCDRRRQALRLVTIP